MSTKYPGGIISKTAPTPSGPYSDSTAPGVWTLEQQAYWQKLGQWPTAGNAPPSAFIENLFSTYLWAGTGNQLSINNGIDLSTNGGMVWIKNRSSAAYNNNIFDTIRGFTYSGSQPMGNNLITSSTDAQAYLGYGFSAFNSNGFRVGYNDGAGTNAADTNVNGSGNNYVGWSFRKQTKFFDMVSWTGNGSYPRTISHNLGSTPGCIIIKSYSDAGYGWMVWHRSLGATQYLMLNNTNVAATDANIWGGTPTSTTFSVGSYSGCNASGVSYVAYVFAHDAGGFGTSGSENVISCGTYNGSGAAGNPITLGYEPQWILTKRTTAVSSWYLQDIVRGMPYVSDMVVTSPNTSAADSSIGSSMIQPTATGFQFASGSPGWNGSGDTYIYIAIRRGPMAVPTTSTNIFVPLSVAPVAGPTTTFTTNFPVDLIMERNIQNASADLFVDRLRGGYVSLDSTTTGAESNAYPTGMGLLDSSTTVISQNWNSGYGNIIGWNFKRAPSFFDMVCYTGNSATPRTITHNLGVAPELMLIKSRSNARGWAVYSNAVGSNKYLILNAANAALTDATIWANTAPTSNVFTVGDPNDVNNSGFTYIAYLFATTAGVSKVGSYTGTGTTQTINCGFTAGSRFVMVKRTDSTGDWYVWDSARGIVPGNDPYLLLNSTAAEVTGTDYIDTASSGFEISSTAPAAINASGGTFIFLAIA
jgi:hypothetical protein